MATCSHCVLSFSFFTFARYKKNTFCNGVLFFIVLLNVGWQIYLVFFQACKKK